jgi:hypothetical protein
MPRGNPGKLATTGKGRPKGSPNKTSQLAKEAIAFAADQLGGGARLYKWAQEAPENERIFWQAIYPKLIAVQVDANVSGKQTITHQSAGIPEILGIVGKAAEDSGI